MDTKAIAQQKIDRALDKIEAAQKLLSEACSELCPIIGMCDEWTRVGDLYDKVKAGWHLVNDGRYGRIIDLDSDAKRVLHGKNVHAPHPIEHPCVDCDSEGARES